MKLSTAIVITVITSFLIRVALGAILITASYELDTYILRLASVCIGIWIILMAVRKIFVLRRVFKDLHKTSE